MKPSVILNYIVACIAVLGVLFCWVQHWETKQALRNPLIPARLAEISYKPAMLYMVVFSVIIVLQLLSVYYKKGQYAAAFFGIVAIVAGAVFYPYLAGWFL